jgi:hypothetical protein
MAEALGNRHPRCEQVGSIFATGWHARLHHTQEDARACSGWDVWCPPALEVVLVERIQHGCQLLEFSLAREEEEEVGGCDKTNKREADRVQERQREASQRRVTLHGSRSHNTITPEGNNCHSRPRGCPTFNSNILRKRSEAASPSIAANSGLGGAQCRQQTSRLMTARACTKSQGPQSIWKKGEKSSPLLFFCPVFERLLTAHPTNKQNRKW